MKILAVAVVGALATVVIAASVISGAVYYDQKSGVLRLKEQEAYLSEQITARQCFEEAKENNPVIRGIFNVWEIDLAYAGFSEADRKLLDVYSYDFNNAVTRWVAQNKLTSDMTPKQKVGILSSTENTAPRSVCVETTNNFASKIEKLERWR